MKKGPISKKEAEYIRANARVMSATDIAGRLDRHAETIQKWIQANVLEEVIPPPISTTTPPAQPEVPSTTRSQLRADSAYKLIKEQFYPSELRYFEDRYCDLVSQFREDVEASEKMQIQQLIQTEILANRNLIQRQRSVEDISQLQAMVDAIRKKITNPAEMTDAEKEELLRLEELIRQCQSGQKSLTSEWVSYTEQHRRLLDDLKATRQQRITRAESSKQTLIGFFRQLEDEAERDRLGRQMAIMKEVSQREAERLARPHRYESGEIDQPLFNADTVLSPDGIPSAQLAGD